MKPRLASLRIPVALTILAALLVAAPASAAQKAAPTPADLQVIVDVPSTWRPFLDDDIAEALFYRLRNVFKAQGYKGEMVQILATEKENKETPTLRLHLNEWRVDRVGNAQCTLTATMRTNAGEKSLGLASGTAILWANGSRWSFSRQLDTADALEDAADSASREVFDAVAKSGLVAGVAPKK